MADPRQEYLNTIFAQADSRKAAEVVVTESGYGISSLVFYLVTFVIIFVIVWLILYTFRFSFVINAGTNDINQGKLAGSAAIIAAIITLVVWAGNIVKGCFGLTAAV